MCLSGHSDFNNHMDWSPFQEGTLISGGQNDGQILIWDVAASSQLEQNIYPSTKIAYNQKITSIKNSKTDRHLFGATTKSGLLSLWDPRALQSQTPVQSVSVFDYHKKSSSSQITCLDFSPFNPTASKIAIGCTNGQTCIFDLRFIGKKLFTLQTSTSAITNIEWSKIHESIIASCS
jgi:WD40 repeat protein